MRTVRIYLSPGMFGFATLAAYDYFEHVVEALRLRFEAAGQQVQLAVCEVHPTASIRRRAAKLAQMITASAGVDEGPIHIVGHSTGGLDARLVASPSVRLEEGASGEHPWVHRLRSVSTINTPHYGTPLATFFATAQGQRLLYAVCALTVAALKLGGLPLSAASGLLAAVRRSGEPLGFELAERLTDTVMQLLDDAASPDLRDWLRQVRDDQGGVVQLMPEAMDLFEAGVEDRPGVRYQCVASYAEPGLRGWVGAMRTPWSVVSAVLFQILHRITALRDDRYPCSAPEERAAAQLRAACGETPPLDANDGVVPLRSQLWGELVWLSSGAGFSAVGFEAAMDCMAEGMRAAH
jgi:triacylglycerol lipase